MERSSHPAGLGGPAAVPARDRKSERHEAEGGSGTREQTAWPGCPDVGRWYRGLDSIGEELDFTPGVMGSDWKASWKTFNFKMIFDLSCFPLLPSPTTATSSTSRLHLLRSSHRSVTINQTPGLFRFHYFRVNVFFPDPGSHVGHTLHFVVMSPEAPLGCDGVTFLGLDDLDNLVEWWPGVLKDVLRFEFV